MNTTELITKFTPSRPTRQQIIDHIEDIDERQVALHYYSYAKSPYLSR